MGFLKSKSSAALVRRSEEGSTKTARNSAGMQMRLSSASVIADSRDDLGTQGSSRDSTPISPRSGRSGRRSQRQRKPTRAERKPTTVALPKKKPTAVTLPEKKPMAAALPEKKPTAMTPAELMTVVSKPPVSKPPVSPRSQGFGQKQSRSRGRVTEVASMGSSSIEPEPETDYSASYSTGSEDESDNSTYVTYDEATANTSFDSTTRRRMDRSARRQSEARRHRNRCATPPPRPEPERVKSPVRDAVARFDAFSKLDDLISPQSSGAEESNPSTESRVKNLVIDFVVQNEVNQLTIQNTIHGNVEKLHLHVSYRFPSFSFSL